ncbi:MAG: MBL fold metallo-hydrolase, partial [Angelakisella sp.]
MSEYFCSFASGSTGNCAFYSGSGARVLIDAGTNTKHISACLRQLGLTTHDLTHILLTHAHSDHTGALPVLMRHTEAQLLCSEGTARRLNIDWEDITVFGKNERLLLQELEVQTFTTSH